MVKPKKPKGAEAEPTLSSPSPPAETVKVTSSETFPENTAKPTAVKALTTVLSHSHPHGDIAIVTSPSLGSGLTKEG